MNTTKFKSLFPNLLIAEDLEDSLLDHLLVKPYQRNPEFDSKITDKGWELRIPLPGASKEDITVEVKDNNQLVVEANSESVWGQSQIRKFKMPSGCDSDNIEGEMKNGILILFIPKKKSFKEKTIKIK